ncbi:helix-turn-helix domain-containing protein [Streptomyces sp. NPDC059835]|uniref:helix-turn-helix domain-containing protein n=1 Tax=Streptomyces sp. NPDC059835 TaxID=3346967 RepID=UPI003664AF56
MPSDPPGWVLAHRAVIGAPIRAARTTPQLSQVQLGECAGIDHKTIHRIEYGISDPRLSVLLLIVGAVGVPLADLIRE